MIRQYSHKELAEKVTHLCKNDKYKFIYISWNGWSGKSSFSKLLIEASKQYWTSTNYIDTDDFLINSQLRKSSTKRWIDNHNNKRTSYYSSAFE